jgi:hypothetical protein
MWGLKDALSWELVSVEDGMLVVRSRILGRTTRAQHLPVDQELSLESVVPGSFWFGDPGGTQSVVQAEWRGETVQFAGGLPSREHQRLIDLLRERLDLPEPTEDETDSDELFDSSLAGRIADKLLRL